MRLFRGGFRSFRNNVSAAEQTDGEEMNQKLLAKQLNLSQSAVSLALKGSPRIPEKTRRVVLAAAAEAGYRPSVAGQLLRGRKTNLVGVVLPDLGNEFFAELFQGIQQRLLEQGYLVCLTRAETPEELRFAVRYLRELHVAGVIALSVSPEPLFKLREEGTALVFYGGNAPLRFPASQVLPDRRTAAREMTAHLLATGRRRIAFLGVSSADEQRFVGYQEALDEAGIKFNLALSDNHEGGTLEGGFRMMKLLLADGRAATIDAVFAHNDSTAIGVLRAAAEAKVAVPEDIAVAGFDNIRVGAFLSPPLTTVEQPQEEIVAVLVDELLATMRDPGHHELIRIPCRLLVRRSA